MTDQNRFVRSADRQLVFRGSRVLAIVPERPRYLADVITSGVVAEVDRLAAEAQEASPAA